MLRSVCVDNDTAVDDETFTNIVGRKDVFLNGSLG